MHQRTYSEATTGRHGEADNRGGGGTPPGLLSPISWPNKKSGRPPGRDPAIQAAAGGILLAAREGSD